MDEAGRRADGVEHRGVALGPVLFDHEVLRAVRVHVPKIPRDGPIGCGEIGQRLHEHVVGLEQQHVRRDELRAHLRRSEELADRVGPVEHAEAKVRLDHLPRELNGEHRRDLGFEAIGLAALGRA